MPQRSEVDPALQKKVEELNGHAGATTVGPDEVEPLARELLRASGASARSLRASLHVGPPPEHHPSLLVEADDVEGHFGPLPVSAGSVSMSITNESSGQGLTAHVTTDAAALVRRRIGERFEGTNINTALAGAARRMGVQPGVVGELATSEGKPFMTLRRGVLPGH